MKDYDAERYAVEEALLNIVPILNSLLKILTYINNQAAISSLANQITNSKPSQKATNYVKQLSQLAIDISTILMPSHSNIDTNIITDHILR
jgi:hypothetical protein